MSTNKSEDTKNADQPTIATRMGIDAPGRPDTGYDDTLPSPTADVPIPDFEVKPTYNPLFWRDEYNITKSEGQGINFKFKENLEKYDEYFEEFRSQVEAFRAHVATDEDHPQRAAILRHRGDANSLRAITAGTSKEMRVVDGEVAPQIFTFLMRNMAYHGEESHVIIAESEDHAKEIEDTVTRPLQDDCYIKTAELFGLPSCCAEFYTYCAQDLGVLDPVYEAACNSPSAVEEDLHINEEKEWENKHTVKVPDAIAGLNPMWRFINLKVLNHFPCCYECEEAAEHGRAMWSAYKEYDIAQETTAFTDEFLDVGTTYEVSETEAHIRHPAVIGHYAGPAYHDNKEVIWKEEHEPTTHGATLE